jgi:elongation factor Ts
MAAFTAKDVKALREKTGCGMMDCKKALTQADGDMDKAIDFLREQGLAKQAKKASRIAAEGVAYAVTTDDCKVGVVIEVNAETDFVAKNDSFMDFVKACANTVIKENPADVEALWLSRQTAPSRLWQRCCRRRCSPSARTFRFAVLSAWKALALPMYTQAAKSAFW